MTEAHEEEEFDRDNEENDMPLLHLTKRKRRPIVCEKSPRERGTKRHRFSLPFSSDQEGETGVKSECSNYAPSKAHSFSESRPAFSHSTGFERDTSDNGEMEFAGEPLRMAVIYEQQSWEGEIIAGRDMKQGRGRPRKQYLTKWKPSWVDGGRLTAPGLIQDWREKSAARV